MTGAEALIVLGQLFGVYVTGFFLGYTITVVKQFLEKV